MEKLKINRPTPYSMEYALKKLPSQFEVAMLAAKKARVLRAEGVDWYRTEALKEIASGDLTVREINNGK